MEEAIRAATPSHHQKIYRRVVRWRWSGIRWKHPPAQLSFTEVIRQRPGDPSSLGGMEIFVDDAERKTELPGDLALGKSGFIFEPEQIFEFAHRDWWR